VYDLFGAGYRGFAGSGLGYAVSDGFCPLEALPNKVVFAASAGDIILFDIVSQRISPISPPGRSPLNRNLTRATAGNFSHQYAQQ